MRLSILGVACLLIAAARTGASMRAVQHDDEGDEARSMVLEQASKLMSASKFAEFEAKLEKQRKGMCDACKDLRPPDDVYLKLEAPMSIQRLTRAQALGGASANAGTISRLRSGEPFIIIDALAECDGVIDPLMLSTHKFWADYLTRALELGRHVGRSRGVGKRKKRRKAQFEEARPSKAKQRKEQRAMQTFLDESFSSFDSSFSSVGLLHADPSLSSESSV